MWRTSPASKPDVPSFCFDIRQQLVFVGEVIEIRRIKQYAVDAEIFFQIVDRAKNAGRCALLELFAGVGDTEHDVHAGRPDDAADGVINRTVAAGFDGELVADGKAFELAEFL